MTYLLHKQLRTSLLSLSGELVVAIGMLEAISYRHNSVLLVDNTFLDDCNNVINDIDDNSKDHLWIRLAQPLDVYLREGSLVVGEIAVLGGIATAYTNRSGKLNASLTQGKLIIRVYPNVGAPLAYLALKAHLVVSTTLSLAMYSMVLDSRINRRAQRIVDTDFSSLNRKQLNRVVSTIKELTIKSEELEEYRVFLINTIVNCKKGSRLDMGLSLKLLSLYGTSRKEVEEIEDNAEQARAIEELSERFSKV